MHNEPQEDIFHITARYVAEVQAGKQPIISDYISRYPQYADALVDFAAYYQSFEAGAPSPPSSLSSAPLSQVSQVALTRALDRVQAEASATITTLLATGTRSFTLSELARKLDLSIDIVALLEQRIIDPSTLPMELYRRIADILQQPVSVVQTYLARSPVNADFAKEARPSLKVAEDPALYHSPGNQYSPEQSFRSLIEESLWLSPTQRATWQAILTQEGL
jgi:hypothetical protein